MLERFLQKADPQPRDYTLLELDELWRKAAIHDAAIGLHLFGTFTPQDWHPLAYLSQLCANVGEAIDCWVRYGQLTSDMERLSRIEQGGLVGVDIDLDAPEELTRYVIEHYSVMAVTQLRRGTETTLTPRRVEFRHARPHYHAHYRQWFGDDLHFGSARNRLLFDSEVLRTPMHAGNAALMELLRSELDRRLSLRRQLDGWAGKVALEVRGSLRRDAVAPSLEDVASALGQSPRTLRRRLADEAITYRELLDRVRLELEQLLELQGLTRGEIAVRLGYCDAAAYLHARKRWHMDADAATDVVEPQ